MQQRVLVAAEQGTPGQVSAQVWGLAALCSSSLAGCNVRGLVVEALVLAKEAKQISSYEGLSTGSVVLLEDASKAVAQPREEFGLAHCCAIRTAAEGLTLSSYNIALLSGNGYPTPPPLHSTQHQVVEKKKSASGKKSCYRTSENRSGSWGLPIRCKAAGGAELRGRVSGAVVADLFLVYHEHYISQLSQLFCLLLIHQI